MNSNGFARATAVGVGFILLCATSGLIRAQAHAAPAVAATTEAPSDDFAGLKFTEEQSAKIDKIRATIKGRTDAVMKDDKLDQDQRTAFLQGLHRMENNEIYSQVLTREQQAAVRKKVLARRKSMQDEQGKKEQQAMAPVSK